MGSAAGVSATVLLMMAAGACSDDDTFPVDPAARAGRGGASGAAGGAGMSGSAGIGGSAGGAVLDGGAHDDAGPPDAGLPRLVASLSGDSVNLSSLGEVWIQRCAENFQMVRREGDGWTPLRDDRPEATNLVYDAHYLDGALNAACVLTVGCDVGGCEALSEGLDSYQRSRLIAREFVEVGQAAAPTCDYLDAGLDLDGGSDASVRQIPDIEVRVPQGALGVSVRYSPNAECRPAVTLVVPVE